MKLSGFEELRASLRALPADLTAEAGHIVEGAANGAASDIKSEYGNHVRSGNLRDGVRVTHSASGLTAKSVVKSVSPHAWLFENGSQARHTSIGANRGAMPPFHVLIPAAIRARRVMVTQLIALVELAGLTVTNRGE